MAHTITQIMENQKEFKELIMDFFRKEQRESKRILRNIVTDDKEIQELLGELKKKQKNFNPSVVKKFFFKHPKRSQEYYAWWDEEEEEAFILNYARPKRQRERKQKSV